MTDILYFLAPAVPLLGSVVGVQWKLSVIIFFPVVDWLPLYCNSKRHTNLSPLSSHFDWLVGLHWHFTCLFISGCYASSTGQWSPNFICSKASCIFNSFCSLITHSCDSASPSKLSSFFSKSQPSSSPYQTNHFRKSSSFPEVVLQPVQVAVCTWAMGRAGAHGDITSSMIITFFILDFFNVSILIMAHSSQHIHISHTYILQWNCYSLHINYEDLL